MALRHSRAVAPDGPRVAALAVIGHEVRRIANVPLGVQVLAGANQCALAVALACGASFVRVEGFVFADVKKKHSAHALTADVSLVETAKAAEFFLVDGVIVSGVATGQPADASEVRAVARAVEVPTLVGSGVTADSLHDYLDADALIVGSSIKRGGIWSGPIEESRARKLARAFNKR